MLSHLILVDHLLQIALVTPNLSKKSLRSPVSPCSELSFKHANNKLFPEENNMAN